MVRDALV
jgi:hypothetical protein